MSRTALQGTMMEWPLLISSQIEHARRIHGDRPVVSRSTDGAIVRITWSEVAARCARLAHALAHRGVTEGDRVATLAWNDHRHLELYFGVSGMGAVLHTLNPRLHPDQLVYIVNHAADRLLFLDRTFLPLVRGIAHRLESVEDFVVLEDADGMPDRGVPTSGAPAGPGATGDEAEAPERLDLLCYEELLDGRPERYDWPELEENAAAALCYTSGTTGHPKGVLYSHRSTVLHSWAVALPDVIPMGLSESYLPVVPMFHANAWGAPYACAMTGTTLVLPGPALDGASLTEIMNEAGVTSAAGVPTIWMGLVEHWRTSGERVPSLEVVMVGGAAPPPSLVRAFEGEFGVRCRHGWGMTEMSPVGTVNALPPADLDRPVDERVELQAKQGRPLFGVEMKVVDEEGEELPWDGESPGELLVRGPWVCGGYFRMDESRAHREDGWFATGDVVTIDPEGRIQITDRKKDIIKSGGEWISSIDLENLAMGHPAVARAAVVGVPHEKWQERPVLFVVPVEGADPEPDELLAFFEGEVPKWWIPDEVVFRDALPVGGTGKVRKTELRTAWEEGRAAAAD